MSRTLLRSECAADVLCRVRVLKTFRLEVSEFPQFLRMLNYVCTALLRVNFASAVSFSHKPFHHEAFTQILVLTETWAYMLPGDTRGARIRASQP